MNHLKSDPHNFRRFVRLSSDGRILKPRNVYGERLFCSEDSHLRRAFASLLSNEYNPFLLMPSIKFFNEEYPRPSLSDNEIEFFSVDHLQRPLTERERILLGCSLPLYLWVGLVDLHRDNIFWGTKNGHFVCAPADLEMLFYSGKQFLAENSVLPQSNASSNIDQPDPYGLRHYEENLKKFPPTALELAQILKGYFYLGDFILRNQKNLFPTLTEGFMDEQLITRVTLRPTRDYKYVSQDALIEEEIIQLARGDVPYFFKKLKEPHVYYWASEVDLKIVSPDRLKHFRIPPSLSGSSEDYHSDYRENLLRFSQKVVAFFAPFIDHDFHLTYQDVTILRKSRKMYVDSIFGLQRYEISLP